jgi:hypothetical protein
MRSVPPRGNGWVLRLLVVDFGFQISVSVSANRQSANWQSKTQPLPSSGAEFMGQDVVKMQPELIPANAERIGSAVNVVEP